MREILDLADFLTNAEAQLAQIEDDLVHSSSEKPAIEVVTKIVYTKPVRQAMRNSTRER